MDDRWICLMYHDVATAAPSVSGGPQHFSVSDRDFGRQLDLIRDAGFRGCSVAEALTSPGTKRVAISFDDGDSGQLEYAVPQLVERGMTATFYIPTAWRDRPGYISWAGLREMRDAGMSIQSHTHSHPFLSELDRPALLDELRRSKDALDSELQQSTTEIALPGGDPPRRALRDVLSEAGYSVVSTSRWGVNAGGTRAPLTWVKRCTVRGPLDETHFRRVLIGDPWLTVKRDLRDAVLRSGGAVLGRTRYARWRRRVLDVISGVQA